MNFYEQIIRYKLTGETDISFAEKLGVSRQRLSHWKKTYPNIKTVLDLALKLGVHPSSLLFGENEIPKKKGTIHNPKRRQITE